MCIFLMFVVVIVRRVICECVIGLVWIVDEIEVFFFDRFGRKMG